MYINPVSYQPNYSTQKINNAPSFTGITKVMSHSIGIDGKKDVLEILKRRPGKNTRVGQLPQIFFERIPKELRTEAFNEIFTAFEQCADEIRVFKAPTGLQNRIKCSKETVEKLKAVLMKYNILDEPEKFDLQYINEGEGNYKKAFRVLGIQNSAKPLMQKVKRIITDPITGKTKKITTKEVAKDPKTGEIIRIPGTEEDFCFKVFHLVDKTPEWHKYKCHGNYAEINISMYWKKHVGDYTQRNKFYFGDIEHGFLVDRYIEPRMEGPKKIIDEYDFGVKMTDEVGQQIGHNKIAGYNIGEGGSRVVNRVKNQSKTARYVLKLIKETPENDRPAAWQKILDTYTHLDDVQKKAGLALSIKHMPNRIQEKLMEKCLSWDIPLVDQSLAYALKYLPFEKVPKFFDTLMRRENPITQTVVLNEIPLLSKITMPVARFDDIDTAKSEIDPEMIKRYYDMAARTVLPEIEEHLASYIHLLPKDCMLPYAQKLVNRHDPRIDDRLLHKIKFVKEDQYSYEDKKAVLEMVERNTRDNFITRKAMQVRQALVQSTLAED